MRIFKEKYEVLFYDICGFVKRTLGSSDMNYDWQEGLWQRPVPLSLPTEG